ncbi:MAG: GNAT family N-acetyltransferase, partial [Pseudomonadota bacterium]
FRKEEVTSRRCLLAPQGAAAHDAAWFRATLPRLETARLFLRAADLTDFSLWSRLMRGPYAPRLGGPLTEEEAWEAYCVYTAGWLLHGHGLWAIDQKGAQRPVGFVLVGLEWTDDEPELGWMLDPTARGQGLATEAAAAARDHAVSVLPRGGVVSYIDPDNAPSARLAARLGAHRDRAAEAAIGDGTQVWRHGVAA